MAVGVGTEDLIGQAWATGSSLEMKGCQLLLSAGQKVERATGMVLRDIYVGDQDHACPLQGQAGCVARASPPLRPHTIIFIWLTFHRSEGSQD